MFSSKTEKLSVASVLSFQFVFVKNNDNFDRRMRRVVKQLSKFKRPGFSKTKNFSNSTQFFF